MAESPADKIRRLRISKGWSQEQLAQAAQLSPRTIRRIESHRTMSLESRQALAATLEVDAEDLVDAAAKVPPQDGSLDLHVKDGRSLLYALHGAQRYETRLDDARHETTADLIKALLGAIDTAKAWDTLSFAGRTTRSGNFRPRAQHYGNAQTAVTRQSTSSFPTGSMNCWQPKVLQVNRPTSTSTVSQAW
jgi:transcriptional regulator with XRE-family HTH domain